MHPRRVGKSRSFAGPCFDGTTNGSSEPGQPGFTGRIKQMGFTAAITATEPFDRFSFIQFCDRVRPAMLARTFGGGLVSSLFWRRDQFTLAPPYRRHQHSIRAGSILWL